MRSLRTFAVSLVVAIACTGPAVADAYTDAAAAQALVASRFSVPSGYEPGFALSNAYPTALPTEPMPWSTIDFTVEPELYLRTVLDYVLEGNREVDWRIGENAVRKWYHAPWMHFGRRGREPIRGLTSERGSDPQELHANQSFNTKNWAVGFYNAYGGYTLGQVWKDPAHPATENVIFPVGTVSAKLLFTDADPMVVDYLQGSLQWDAQIVRNQLPVKMSLLQVDLAIRDARADTRTGWVFGTYVFWHDPTKTDVWDQLVPVGLHWGNDTNRTLQDQMAGTPLADGWINPTINTYFSALPRQWLGLWGRMNGPVDNKSSACLACHGRALDLGESPLRPPFTPNLGNPQDIIHFFTDRKPDEPFFPGMRPLDYSLQLSDGVANFREWVRINFPDKVDDIYGDVVTPMSLNFEFLRRQFPVSQESLARTLAEDSYSSPFARGENE